MNSLNEEICSAINEKDTFKIINLINNSKDNLSELLSVYNLSELLQPTEYYNSLLHQAIKNKMFDLLDFLIDKKVKIDYIQPIQNYKKLDSKEYNTIVFNNPESDKKIRYDQHRYYGLIKYPEENGITEKETNLSAINKCYPSPLRDAIKYNTNNDMIKYIKYFIENGAEISPNTVYNDTPLYYAILLNQYEVIDLLIDNNVKLNYPGYKCKFTPIYHLLLNYNIQFLEELEFYKLYRIIFKVLDKNVKLDYKIYEDKPNEPKNNPLYYLICIDEFTDIYKKFINKLQK